MYEHKIIYTSQSQITIENTPANRISEADFYAGLEVSENGKMVTGEWFLENGSRIWMSEFNDEKGVFRLKARLALKGICIGETNPYILQAELTH